MTVFMSPLQGSGLIISSQLTEQRTLEADLEHSAGPMASQLGVELNYPIQLENLSEGYRGS